MLGFLSSKVLGQFDPFYAPTPAVCCWSRRTSFTSSANWRRSARLPALGVPARGDPPGAVHRRTRGCATTSLRDAEDRDGSTIRRVARRRLGRIGEAFKAARRDGTLIEMLSTPEQQEVIDRITGVMSLLEGHADVVMDGVGPVVIPSVGQIRKRFTERRKGVGVLDRLIRRLMGLDAKMAQYRDGAVFVRAVVDKVGMDGFNAVWAGPTTCPSKAEILDPEAWLDARPLRLRTLSSTRRRRGTAWRCAAAWRISTRAGPSGGLLRRCGLARAARGHRLRGARRAAGAWSGSPSTTGCRTGRPRRPTASSPRWQGSASTRP